MKITYALLSALALICSSITVNAQWTDVINNNINFRYQVDYQSYSGTNDGDGQCDPVMRNDFYISSNGGSWTGWSCHAWECVAPCYSSGNSTVHSFYDKPFNTYVQITGQFYESDNSNSCTNQVGDDHYWNGYGTFRGGQSYIPVTYQSTDFYPGEWNPNLGVAGSGWIFPEAASFDQIWSQIWRYRYGDNNGALLNFGTVGIGESKRDVNSNRTITPNDGLMVYSHTSESVNPSPDVWYEFTLAEPANVSITTSSGHTDFDTYIRLFDSNDNFIAADYDAGGNLTSLISTKLCAGNYKFLVEGYLNNTGVFEVTVSASAPNVLSSIHDINRESCPGEADGSVAISGFTGGVAPYTINWNNSPTTSLSFYNLEQGVYPLIITDACGTSFIEPIVVPGDNNPPTAVCINEYTINVSQGNVTSLVDHPDIFDQGSYDNCGIWAYSASQLDFTVSDVGSNTVTMYVLDEAENVGECNFTLIVNNTTGIAEAELLNEMNIYPNPTTGVFNLDLSNAKLKSDARISILDASGREVYNSSVASRNTLIDLSNSAEGIYLLHLTNDGVSVTQPISVQ